MADELADKYSNLNLCEEEDEIVDCGVLNSNEDKSRALKGKVIIRKIESNLFAFQFFHWKDKEKVLDWCPWSFDQNLLLLNSITGDEQPSEVKLTHSPFWVRIENLPFNCRSNEQISAIATKLGTLLEVEEDNLRINKSRRIKILLDVSKPLRRYLKIRTKDGSVVVINLKYERLPFFCFSCGVLGHSEKDCLLDPGDLSNQGYGWGLWLKASPQKGRRLDLEEMNEIQAAKRISFVPKVDCHEQGKTGKTGNAESQGGVIRENVDIDDMLHDSLMLNDNNHITREKSGIDMGANEVGEEEGIGDVIGETED
uniref:CCHC-type domain-containing protein n=1 Tax=Chenopodium quinoa TaxID=63459 RepID=A0A803MRC1_CHEQI